MTLALRALCPVILLATAFGAGLLLGSTPGDAQTPAKVHRLAIVVPAGNVAVLAETGHPAFRVLFQELRQRGYVEGTNLDVSRLSADGQAARYAELARDAVATRPDVIYAIGTGMTRALQDATTSIPTIAFTGDPIAAGLVLSLARPGGNLTGFSDDAGAEVLAKRLELLRQAMPGASRVAVLAPRSAWESRWGHALREAAPKLGVTLLDTTLGPASETEYRRAFAGMARQWTDAVYVGDQAENYANRRLIVELAARARLPVVYAWRDAVEAGGLMAYGVRFGDVYRGVAGYIDRILTGTPPGELPYQQPTRFELVINAKTARALGRTVPPAVLARADEVIE